MDLEELAKERDALARELRAATQALQGHKHSHANADAESEHRATARRLEHAAVEGCVLASRGASDPARALAWLQETVARQRGVAAVAVHAIATECKKSVGEVSVVCEGLSAEMERLEQALQQVLPQLQASTTRLQSERDGRKRCEREVGEREREWKEERRRWREKEREYLQMIGLHKSFVRGLVASEEGMCRVQERGAPHTLPCLCKHMNSHAFQHKFKICRQQLFAQKLTGHACAACAISMAARSH